MLILKADGQVVAGRVILDGDGVSTTAESGHENFMVDILLDRMSVDGGKRWVTADGDPEAWFAALPVNFSGSRVRARIADAVAKKVMMTAEEDAELDAALRADFGMSLAEADKAVDEGALDEADGIDISKEFDPNQPRDPDGKWGSGGAPPDTPRLVTVSEPEGPGRKGVGFMKDKEIPSGPPQGVFLHCNDPASFTRLVGMTPEQYMGATLSRFKPGEIENVRAIYSVNGKEITTELRMHVKSSDGHLGSLSMDRVIDLNTKTVGHTLFSLSGAVQNGGVGKKLFDASLDLYDHMGIKNLKVHANCDVGGYAWARYGFVPTQESWNNLRENLGGRAREISDVRVRDQVRVLLSDPHPTAIKELAGIKTKVYGFERQSVGKGMLLGKEWYGSMRLDDPKKYAEVRAYVRGK
jgi:hypothetical protein